MWLNAVIMAARAKPLASAIATKPSPSLPRETMKAPALMAPTPTNKKQNVPMNSAAIALGVLSVMARRSLLESPLPGNEP